MTHHHLKDLGKRAMPLGIGETPKIEPITKGGSETLQEKERAWLNEIIKKVNDLFERELMDQGKWVYVNNVINGKLGIGNVATVPRSSLRIHRILRVSY